MLSLLLSKHVFSFESTNDIKTRAPSEKMVYGAAILVLPQGCEKEMIRTELFDSKIPEYLNYYLDPTFELCDGSWNLITVSYRSVIWGAAGIRKSKYDRLTGSLQPGLRAQFKRKDNQEDYEWDLSNSDESFLFTQSCTASTGKVQCTIAFEILSIRRLSLGRRLSSQVDSAVGSVRSVFSR